MRPQYLLSICILIAAMLLVACSEGSSTSGELPPLEGTAAPGPITTPTYVPLAVDDEIQAPDWSRGEHMYAAMRPEYAVDVDEFVDKTRYYVEAELEYGIEAVVINGQQLVRFTNTTEVALDEIVFRLTGNIGRQALQIRVDNVTLDGAPIEPIYEARGSVMAVPLPETLPIGESVEIGMDFIFVAENGVLPTQLGYANDQFQMVNWLPVVSVHEGPELGWFRDRIFGNDWDPYYGEMALFELMFTYDSDLPLAITGITIEEIDNSDGTVTHHIVTGPVRDNFIITSPQFGVITDITEGVTVNVYFMPGGERAAEWVMETSLRSLEIFNETFGEYPYSTLDVAQTETNVGGVEYSNVILIDRGFWQNGSPVTEFITAHEVAHQWWYLLVGNNQTRAPYMDEAMASFSEGVYWREAYDDNGERYDNWIASERNTVNQVRFNVDDMSMYQEPNEINPPQFAAVVYYTQGSVFYDTLEQALRTPANRIGETFAAQGIHQQDTIAAVQNDTSFTRHYNRALYEVDKAEMTYRALQHYFDKMKYKLSNPAEILQSYEAVTGQELDAIFYEFFGEFPGLDPAVIEGEAPTDATNEAENVNTSFIGG